MLALSPPAQSVFVRIMLKTSMKVLNKTWCIVGKINYSTLCPNWAIQPHKLLTGSRAACWVNGGWQYKSKSQDKLWQAATGMWPSKTTLGIPRTLSQCYKHQLCVFKSWNSFCALIVHLANGLRGYQDHTEYEQRKHHWWGMRGSWA